MHEGIRQGQTRIPLSDLYASLAPKLEALQNKADVHFKAVGYPIFGN